MAVIFGKFLATISLLFFSLAAAQDPDTSECGLTCIANVNGTSCGQSEWSCLCLDQQYLTRLSTCVQQGCNQTEYDATINAVAAICNIFSASPTITPFATATSDLTNNPILSTIAVATSLPSVSGSTSTSSIDDIAGTSISTFTTTGVSSGSGAEATASSTTTNVAQRIDLKAHAAQGIALALLGLAFYL